MLKTPLSHADIAQLIEQLVLSAVIPGSSPAVSSPFGPSRAKDPIETSHISRPRQSFGKKLKSFCIKAFEAQYPIEPVDDSSQP